MLDDMHSDNILIEKVGGSQLGPVKASVKKSKIYTETTYSIEIGDVLIRKLPNGTNERYVVTDPGFFSESAIFPAHYQADVRREDAPTPTPGTVNYHINGSHARFNQNSTDNSINVTIESSDGVFEDLKSQLRAGVDDPQRIAELEAIINDMQASQHNGKGMSEKLGQLISKGSDLMGIIGPFVPMLTGIATGASS